MNFVLSGGAILRKGIFGLIAAAMLFLRMGLSAGKDVVRCLPGIFIIAGIIIGWAAVGNNTLSEGHTIQDLIQVVLNTPIINAVAVLVFVGFVYSLGMIFHEALTGKYGKEGLGPDELFMNVYQSLEDCLWDELATAFRGLQVRLKLLVWRWHGSKTNL